jgi:hypothetical protein
MLPADDFSRLDIAQLFFQENPSHTETRFISLRYLPLIGSVCGMIEHTDSVGNSSSCNLNPRSYNHRSCTLVATVPVGCN